MTIPIIKSFFMSKSENYFRSGGVPHAGPQQLTMHLNLVYPGSSGKESTCNAGDPGSIPESGRSPGEGTGYPLPYSWASLVAHMVKNLPAMWETWVQFLG